MVRSGGKSQKTESGKRKAVVAVKKQPSRLRKTSPSFSDSDVQGVFGSLVRSKKPTKDLIMLVAVLVLVFGGMLYAQSAENSGRSVSKSAYEQPLPGGVLVQPRAAFTPQSMLTPVPVSIDAVAKKSVVPILMYHYVRDVNPRLDQLGWNLSISPANFERQLQYLSDRGYRSIHMRDWARGDIPKKAVIITFDDGYDDFYTVALPLLKRYGFTASVGIITDFIGKTNHMNAEQIRDVANSGVELIAHTVSHPDLLNVVPSEARRQVVESKRVLENLFGVDVAAFAYPIGHFNRAIVSFVKEAGYSAALTTAHGLAEWDVDDPYVLPRIRVDNRDGYDGFVKKIEELAGS